MSDEISNEELSERVLYALLGPAARISRVFAFPLGVVRERLEMAYFHETKRQNMKMKDVAELMDVSMSKVALLSRALKANFAQPEEIELTRRIEFMLWAEPLSSAKIKQVLTDVTAKQVNDALRELLDDQRVRKVKRDQTVVYALQIDVDRRGWDSWLARIDGLNNVLKNVTDAIYARFFTDEQAAFARTLTFRIRRQDLDQLKQFYESEFFELIQQLDAAADDGEDVVPINLSLFWAPYEFLERQEQPNGED